MEYKTSEKLRRSNQEWKNKNKERCRQYDKEYREKNKEKIRESRKKSREKARNNPEFRLNNGMRRSIWKALKGNKAGRRWEALVGYTLQDLIRHLETLMDEKMSWDNYGSYWHIDHCKPQSSFNFTSPDDPEFKQCWALENLQPLEAKENLEKYIN